jgi:excisionase family DNA binding protein
MVSDVFLTVGEVATLLRTSAKAVYCMAERGQLAGVTRIGRRVLVNRDVLLSALNKKSTPDRAGK